MGNVDLISSRIVKRINFDHIPMLICAIEKLNIIIIIIIITTEYRLLITSLILHLEMLLLSSSLLLLLLLLLLKSIPLNSRL